MGIPDISEIVSFYFYCGNHVPAGSKKGQVATKSIISQWVFHLLPKPIALRISFTFSSESSLSQKFGAIHRASVAQVCKDATGSSVQTLKKFFYQMDAMAAEVTAFACSVLGPATWLLWA